MKIKNIEQKPIITGTITKFIPIPNIKNIVEQVQEASSFAQEAAEQAEIFSQEAAQSARASAESVSTIIQLKQDTKNFANVASEKAEIAMRASENTQSIIASVTEAAAQAVDNATQAKNAKAAAQLAASKVAQAELKAQQIVQMADDIQNNIESINTTKDIILDAKNRTIEAKNSAINANDNAQNAKVAAETAKNSAVIAQEAAEDAAEEAKNIANDIKQAAEIAAEAIESASSANSSAQSASASASSASTSAETASNSAQSAEQAADGAEASATAAEASATGAETAQAAAETAQGKAEEAAVNAEQSATTAEWYAERVERFLPTDTASGEIASFPDGADSVPMQSVVVTMEPVQDLHGYDHPWPAGGGKNLLPAQIDTIKSINRGGTWSGNVYTWNGVTFAFSVNDDGAVTAIAVSGTATSGTDIAIINLTGSLPNWITAGTTYTVSGNATSAQFQVIPRIGSAYQNTKTNTSFSWDSSWDGVYIRIRVNSGDTASGTIYPMFEVGSTATSYAPYSNLCPISGRTGADIEHTGVNVWDEEWEVGGLSTSDGQPSANPNAIRSKNFIPCLPNTAYYTKTVNLACYLWFYDGDKNFISFVTNNVNRAVTTPSNCRYMKIRAGDANNPLQTYNNDISINYPSTDTAYHAYQGETISVTFPTEAGIVYGGTFGVVSGELVVDRAKKTLSQNDSFVLSQSATRNRITWNDYESVGKTGGLFVSNALKSMPASSGGYGTSDWEMWGSTVAPRCWISVPLSYTIDDFKEFLSSDPIEIVYELATPITYHLTPQEVRTLLGTNNVWSDAGSVAVTYKADVQLYIDKKLA